MLLTQEAEDCGAGGELAACKGLESGYSSDVKQEEVSTLMQPGFDILHFKNNFMEVKRKCLFNVIVYEIMRL